MNTLTAPHQTDSQAWKQTRVGRFTASEIGKLFTAPRTITPAHIEQYGHLCTSVERTKELKSGPRKGMIVPNDAFPAALKVAIEEAGVPFFGDTALSLIASKAAERISCRSDHSVDTRSTDRGTLLEHAARIILSKYWKHIDGVTFQAYGENSGATPDGLVENGTEPVDTKCPESFGDLLLFDTQVPDGDFDALESWDKGFAWQIMHQAKCCGARFANLVYFTDRLPAIILPEALVVEVQDVMNHVAYNLGELTNRPWHYKYETEGFAFVAKRFELTDERSARIDRILNAAEVQCQEFVDRFKAHSLAA